MRVKGTGGDADAVTFSASVSEIGNRVPAMEVRVFAEIEGTTWRFEAPPFHLAAGQLSQRVGIDVPRPALGTLVAECGHHQTLYGRNLMVTALSEEAAVASDQWHEEEYDPERDGARYEVMQRVWEAGLRGS